MEDNIVPSGEYQKMKNDLGKLYVAFLAGIAAILGITYSMYNTDMHHFGFIAGTALDYIQGRKLFTEIFIQYGIGQPLFFKFINYFISINYTIVGIITSFIYAINLIVIYLSVRKISAGTVALLVTTIAFLLHPYAIYPWPDYFAGLSLSLSCYVMLMAPEKEGKLCYTLNTLSGILLFLACLFRNTYIVNITVAFLSYIFISTIYKRLKNNNLLIVFFIFSVLSIGYFIMLAVQGNLHHWFVQGIGAASSQYGVKTSSVQTLIQKVFLLTNKGDYQSFIGQAVFSGLFVMTLYTICIIIFDHNKFNIIDPNSSMGGLILFLGLLGLSGIVQSLQIYEIFRMQNASSPLYLVVGFFLTTQYYERNDTSLNINVKFALGLIIVALLTYFPHGSRLFPIIDGSAGSYAKSEIPFFKGHQFQTQEQVYYNGLSRFICDGRKKIVNLTPDATIPYLCVGQENALNIPFYSELLLRATDEQQANRIVAGDFKMDEVIVTSSPPPLKNLNWIGKVERPSSIRFFSAADVHVFQVEPILNVSPEKSKLTLAIENVRTNKEPVNFLNLSLAYYEAGQFENSIDAAKEALKLKPDYAEAYNNICTAYNNLKMWDKAIIACEEAVRLRPDFQLAKNNLAWARSQLKDQS